MSHTRGEEASSFIESRKREKTLTGVGKTLRITRKEKEKGIGRAPLHNNAREVAAGIPPGHSSLFPSEKKKYREKEKHPGGRQTAYYKKERN